MPILITTKADDANLHFYLDSFNRYSYIPDIGLFVDDISDEDAKLMKSRRTRKKMHEAKTSTLLHEI